MCGIIGYVGHRPAVPVVMEGLERLEYRGYDSAGIAWALQGKINIARERGKLRELEKKLSTMPAITATCAIGHTRWATHGAPAERNAHPHLSNDSSIAVVHNGIIENYQAIKNDLAAGGYVFNSETDTEVLVNLVAECRKTEPDIMRALAKALKIAHGAYAVCFMFAEDPGALYAARISAPLVLGKGTGENFIASDIPAFLPYSREVLFLEDAEIARITASDWQIFQLADLEPVKRETEIIQWDIRAAQKDGYRHFMLKEIFEQPKVIKDGLAGRFESGKICLPELKNMPVPQRLHIVACGTSYHAGLWGSRLIEEWAGITCGVEIASEFRYKNTFLFGDNDVAMLISQSGETADTLAALRLARERKLPVIGLCNVVGSSIAREADAAVFTQAGPEISVASTKAMCSQMLALCLMALYWGSAKNILSESRKKEIMDCLLALPALLDDNLSKMRKKARELAQKYSWAENFFYLGRGYDFPLALEGALKLKELSYIHAEGYAAGEMKHGPIALVDSKFPAFVLSLDRQMFAKVKSNIQEVESRAGQVIALAFPGADLDMNDLWTIPELPLPFSSFMALPALQLFSYEMADYLGKDVDQPRNLAKSVTVE